MTPFVGYRLRVRSLWEGVAHTVAADTRPPRAPLCAYCATYPWDEDLIALATASLSVLPFNRYCSPNTTVLGSCLY